jgi:hypothetical protein
MKKLIFASLFLMLSFNSFAQFGISAGFNLSKYSYAAQSFNIDRKQTMGYNFGLQYKTALSEKTYLLPELSYTIKGANVYFSYPIGTTGPMKYNNHMNYLQLTLPAAIAFPVNDELDYEIGAGLFLGYMINGQSKIEEFDGSTSDRKFDSDDFKQMDYGLQLSTGLRLGKKLGFHFKYDLGLANVEGHSANPAIKTRNFSLNLSFLFSEND